MGDFKINTFDVVLSGKPSQTGFTVDTVRAVRSKEEETCPVLP